MAASSIRNGPRTRASSSAQENGETQFKQFDIATDYSDHHYLDSNRLNNETRSLTNASSDVHKKIMQEWKILEESLPGSIFVRVYEGRIDILRAVIIGAPGTPYHDGLFFFDLVFPFNYPNNPPKAYYHSHGLRLNPNLYDTGMVCLSLLGTWTGSGKEMWDPSSTILQVLVSLQGLVLNEEPYFNEPAMHGANQLTSHKALARAYHNNAFVLSCKTMEYIMKNPPKGFESFVVKHFCERAMGILAACKAYMDGRAIVGYFQVDDESSSPSNYSVSDEFKSSMGNLYPNLVKSFSMIGAVTQNDIDLSLGMVGKIGSEPKAGKKRDVNSKPKAEKKTVKKTSNYKPKTGKKMVEKKTAVSQPKVEKKTVEKKTAISKPKAEKKTVEKKTANSKPKAEKRTVEKETANSKPKAEKKAVVKKTANSKPKANKKTVEKKTANSKPRAGNKNVEEKAIGSKRKASSATKQTEKSIGGKNGTGNGKKRKLNG